MKTLKFTKRQRLLSKADFEKVFAAARQKKGFVVRSGPYLIYQKPSLRGARLGLSVARRVIRKAHDRNRVKRCIREFFRTHGPQLSGDFIIRVMELPTGNVCEVLTKPLIKVLPRNSCA